MPQVRQKRDDEGEGHAVTGALGKLNFLQLIAQEKSDIQSESGAGRSSTYHCWL